MAEASLPTLYCVADMVLVLHVLFVLFVVLGLVLIFTGGARGWSWVRNLWFRRAHLLAIGFVVAESWLGAVCPLTRWEMALRAREGDAVYTGSFIAHWLGRLLYYEAPSWVFVAAYTLFGLLSVVAWLRVRPHSGRKP